MSEKKDETVFFDKASKRKIVTRKDGSVETTSHGNKIKTNPDGSASVKMETITRIQLFNILELQSYNLSRDSEKIQHSFMFNDGSNGVIAYTPEGKILEISFKGGLLISLSPDGVIVIEMKKNGNFERQKNGAKPSDQQLP